MKLITRIFLLLSFLLLYLPQKINAQVTFAKSPQNPIFSPSGWSSNHVSNPIIVIRDGIYQMWYDGHGSAGWRVGHATSTTGIDNWTSYPSPILQVGSIDGWEDETTNPTVIYNNSLGIYQMWYTSLDNSHWASGHDRFRVRYATSLDGSTWTRNSWVLTGTLNSWDTGGIARGLSVIFLDGIYHLWYAGTNAEDLTTNPFWRIGYAISSDGINWIKQNNGQPVIMPTELWEFNNVSYPTVLYENGMFKMWYGTGSGDLPTEIAYATSLDGINWYKQSVNNPVLTRETTFESIFLSSPSVQRINPTTLGMWYSSYGSINGQLAWRINFATATTDPIQSTPTPTPTPSPSPTPTPSPTPSPTPIGPKKVVVVPGFGGSWNKDALLNCKTDNYTGNWSEWSIANANIYQPLLDNLQNAGYEPVPFYYDWRKRVTDTIPTLGSFIQNHRTAEETVDLVGHSLGGLVGRAYLENTQTNSHLDKLLTVGSPHQGSVIVYPAWSGGAIWNNDIRFRLATTLLQVGCMLRHGWSSRETIQNIFPSIQNILPTFDYLQDARANTTKPVSSMHAKNNWLPTSFSIPYYGVEIGSIAGTGHDTLKKLEVTQPSRSDIRQGNWLDGKPTSRKYYADGDGTVLAESAQLPNAYNQTLALDHGALVTAQPGIEAIISFLSDASFQTSFTTQALQLSKQIQSIQPNTDTAALLIVVDNADITLIDRLGTRMEDSDGQITVLSPHDEAYTLSINPDKNWRNWWKHRYKVLVIQLYEDGTSSWKEYTDHTFFTKKWKVRFDRKFKHPDILRDR
jgi:pimeloyl-ACP methyl ester carboxylesterase